MPAKTEKSSTKRVTRSPADAARRTTKPAASVKKSRPAKDPILEARYEAEVTRYRKARGEETASWDERYEALGEILENELYLAAGYKSARAFLAVEAPGQDERTAKTYVRVAQHFDPADEEKYGISKLDGLLDYLEATGGLSEHARLNLARQTIRVPGKGGTTKRVPFGDITVADLRAATRKARSGTGTTGRTASPMEKAVRALLAKAALGAVGVRVRKDRVDLTGVPLEKLAKLGATLAKARLSVD